MPYLARSRRPVAGAAWVASLLVCSAAPRDARAAAVVRGELAAPAHGTARALAVVGHRAYVLVRDDAAGAPSGSSLVVVDVSAAAAPRRIAATELPFAATRIAVTGGRAYLATSDAARELAVVDLADEKAPRVVGTFDLPGAPVTTAIAVAGPAPDRRRTTTAYLGARAGDGKELYVVDATDPAEMTALGAHEIGATVTDLALRGGTVYAATSDPAREIVVLDGPRPGALAARGTRDLPGDGATAVAVERDRVYVATTAALVVLDDPPGGPPLATRTSVAIEAAPVGILVQGGHAFVASSTPGRALSLVDVGGDTAHVAETVTGAAPAAAAALGAHDVLLAGAPGAPLLQVVDPGTPLAAVGDSNGDGLVTVVCLGDSNTMYDHAGGRRRGWCELLDDAISNPSWRFANHAFLGMTAVDLGRTFELTPLYVDTLATAPAWYIDAALAEDAADVAILAFGTNDLRGGTGPRTATPEELLRAYEDHTAKLERAGVGRVLVALTPPTFPPSSPADAPVIAAANDLLRARLPASAVLDFFSGMTPEDYGYAGEHDGVHVGPSGQQKRMQAAYRRLVLGE